MLNHIKKALTKSPTYLILVIALLCTAYSMNFRVYLPFMIGAYIIAFLIYASQRESGKQRNAKSIILDFFSKDIWLHRSARNDYSIIAINAGMVLLLLPAIVLHPDTVINIMRVPISFFLQENQTSTPGIIAISLYAILTFCASDFMYYWAHRVQHEFPWLWEFHKVHHSAEVLTPLTLYRAHPVEWWMSSSFRMFGKGVVAGGFIYLYPNIEALATVAGVNVFWIIFSATISNLRHTHIWISFGPNIEKVLMSPAQHQIHHSDKRKHFDKNYGSDLSIWDWIFGTSYLTDKKENIKFGLGSEKEHEDMQTLNQLYITPFMKALEIIIKPLKDKNNKV